jgi:hypothetical protein
LRWLYYVAIVAGLLLADAETIPFFVGFPMLLGIAFWFVAYAKCPFCVGEIARGPKQRSYLEVMLGKYPQHCTHCGAPVGAVEYVVPDPEPAPAPKPPKPRRTKPNTNALVDDLFYDMATKKRRPSRRRSRRRASELTA